MKNQNLKIKILFLAILFCGVFGAAGYSQAANKNLPDCVQATVLAAISSAAAGDTIVCPAGSWTWSTPVTIPKALTLQGATTGCPGSCTGGGTIITGSIIIQPSAPDLDPVIDLSQFSFNGNATAGIGITVNNISTSVILSKIRVHHNKIYNYGGASADGVGLLISGWVYGLYDHNYLSTCAEMIQIYGSNTGAEWRVPMAVGTSNMAYLEDNIIYSGISGRGDTWLIHSSYGDRYAFRHNTIDLTLTGYTIIDNHGNFASTDNCADGNSMVYGQVGSEVYDNAFTNCNGTTRLIDQRAGTNIAFNNTVGGSVDPVLEVREEDGSNLNSCYPLKTHGQRPYWDPIINTYMWSNTYSGSRLYLTDSENNLLDAQTDYWADTTKNTNSASAYFMKGLHSARPTGTLTVGNVYWETDTQTLYRCTSTNTWTQIYQPYTYPHPLQGAIDNIPPAPPTGLAVR